ncbi:MAG: efflux transporter outer membrane subunit [Gammaproteobacteria bacterium]|nr:efflux transporter outer membrane subunit [Gammaproteobacteria bacterium]
MHLSTNKSSLLILVLALSLGACAVGPDFTRPASPTVQDYLKTKMPKTIVAGHNETKQHLSVGKTVSNEWWELFHSRQLDDVVTLALDNNQTLAASVATLAAAQDAIRIASGALFPQVDANAGFQRQNSLGGGGSNSGSNPISNLYSVGATVSYVPDVFGLTRRTIEQQTALAENQLYQLGAAYLTITGNVVTQAITVATLRGQLAAVKSIVASDKQNYTLVKEKMEAGKVARIDLLTAESQLANDLTQLPPLRQKISVAEHAISVLVSKSPGEWSPPNFDLAKMRLPPNLPVSLPSALVHQRPDILAAEAQLHADSAAIGIATAQMYPTITLSGAGTFESAVAGGLFAHSNLLWSVAAGLTTPIFHGGSLIAQRDQAVNTFKAAAATYQQTVITAFGQVADTLRALKNDADFLKAQKEALDTAQESLRLQRFSYSEGKSDLLLLLNAERNYHLALQGFVQAQGQRYLDTAQLFLAMGGGWPVPQNYSKRKASIGLSCEARRAG